MDCEADSEADSEADCEADCEALLSPGRIAVRRTVTLGSWCLTASCYQTFIT